MTLWGLSDRAIEGMISIAAEEVPKLLGDETMTENETTEVEVELTAIERKAAELIGSSDVSPYRLATIVSVVAEKRVREQQVYRYCAEGLIVASKATGKWVVKAEDAYAWTVKYATKHNA